MRTLRYETNGATVPALDFTSHAYGLSYTYDASGRRASLRFPSGIGLPATPQQYAYDATTGRLSQITDVRGQAFGFTYTLAGQLDYLNYPGGVAEHPVYDAEGMPQRRTVTGPGVSISDQMTYDPMGRVAHADALLQNGTGGSQHWTTHETHPEQGPVEHYNYEMQRPGEKPGRYEQTNNVHLNKEGKPIE